MSANDETDRSLVEFAQKIAAIPKGIADDESRPAEPPPAASHAASPTATDVGSQSLPPPLPATQPGPDIRPALPVRAGGKPVRTSEEIARLIMKSLRTLDGCPDRGFVVTVYGSNPWNAMLTIRPEAGPRIDRELWRSRVHDIGVQLRNDFDVVDAPTNSTNGST